MWGIDFIEKYIEEKICDLGSEVVMTALAATPVGAALEAMSRINEFIESDGVSELDKLATGELRQLTKPLRFKLEGKELLNKILENFSQPTQTGKSPWAQSRKEWLTDAWRHDWRSQPRNLIGEWIPGRLSYPVADAPAIGKGRARSSRQRRRINRYRRYGRIAARSVVRGP